VGKMTLVDLAGSERQSKTQAQVCRWPGVWVWGWGGWSSLLGRLAQGLSEWWAPATSSLEMC
jgi:hypothetical protein